MIDSQNKIRRAALVAAAAWLTVFSSPLVANAAPTTAAATAPMAAPDGDHEHDWQRESKRNWIPPTEKKVLVGKDKNGDPVYEMKTVKPGRWEIEYKSRCRKCGKVKKG